MSKQLYHDPQLAEAGTKRTIRPNAFLGAGDGAAPTLNAGNEVTIWDRQIPADKVYAHGAGTDNRMSGREAFMYAELVDASGNSIEGDLIAVITDSEQRDVLARYELGDLDTLAAAADDDRTDRPMQKVLAPVAREDRHLELRIVATEESDGVDLDPDASNARLFYTDIAV